MSIVSRTAVPGRASRLISSGALRAAERVDADLGGARDAAQVPVEVASTPDLPILSPPR